MNNWKKMYQDEVKEREHEAFTRAFKPIEPTYEQGKIFGREEVAEIVLDLLGLREDYPNKTEQVARGFGYGFYYAEVEVSGAGDFLKDLLAAKDAINGRASLKKIRKTLKKKETENDV